MELTGHAGLAEAVAGIERLDLLVHSAAVATLGPVARNPAQAWRDTLEVRVVAVGRFAARAFADALRAGEAGSRVTTVHPGRVITATQRSIRVSRSPTGPRDDRGPVSDCSETGPDLRLSPVGTTGFEPATP
ncbi:hypothetical protein [Streptomyces sp. NPDC001781]